MSSNNQDSKTIFKLRKSRFDQKPFTIESLLEERKDLYEKLMLSRDELDSYINYMQKITIEKNSQGKQIVDIQMSNELLQLQKSRLENQNRVLVKECGDLMELLCKFGPKELNTLEAMNSIDQELVFDKVKESIKVIFNDRQDLLTSNEYLKDELEIKNKSLDQTNNTVRDLNTEIDRLTKELLRFQVIDKSVYGAGTNSSRKKLARSQSEKSIRKPRSIVQELTKFYDNPSSTNIENLDPDLAQLTSPVTPEKMSCLDCVYEGKSDEIRSSSTDLNRTVSSNQLAKKADFYKKKFKATEKKYNAMFRDFKSILLKISDPLDKCKIFISERGRLSCDSSVSFLSKSLDINVSEDTAESSSTHIDDSTPKTHNSPNSDRSTYFSSARQSPFESADEAESNDSKMGKLEYIQKRFGTIDKGIHFLLDNLNQLSANKLILDDENKMLQKEVNHLKYALTSRIELKNYKASITPSSNASNKNTAVTCDCEKKTVELTKQVSKLQEEIQEHLKQIETLKQDRFNLIMFMAKNTPNQTEPDDPTEETTPPEV